MALTLQEMEIPARSWQGWQVPINTTAQHSAARFVDYSRANIDPEIHRRVKVAVVAGFQGIGPDGRITTLGRGGSDTTAVAFAAAFGAGTLRHLYRCGRRLYDRSAHHLEGAQA